MGNVQNGNFHRLLTAEDIGNYVASIGDAYVHYKTLIIKNAIDSELLKCLTEEEFYQILQEIGITLLSHRKVLYLRYKDITK